MTKPSCMKISLFKALILKSRSKVLVTLHELSDRSVQGEGSDSFLINIARGFIKGPPSSELTGREDHFSHLV